MLAQHQAWTLVSLMAARRAVAALLSGELEHLLCVPWIDRICFCLQQAVLLLVLLTCVKICTEEAKGNGFQMKFLY